MYYEEASTTLESLATKIQNKEYKSIDFTLVELQNIQTIVHVSSKLINIRCNKKSH